MMRFAILCCALVACVKSNKVVCGDLTCPADYTCDVAKNRCISPEQLAACNNLPDGSACTVSSAPGSCLAGVCEPLVCGDGLVSGAEECDGTNLAGKTCQDFRFYNDAGLTCSAVCTFDVTGCTGYCGDGVINGGELCDGAPPPLGACFDFGYDAGPLGCSSACGASFAQCARIGWHVEPIAGAMPYAGAASGRDDGWLVGAAGAILHWNGILWVPETSPVTSVLTGVAAIAPGDAWAVGPGSPGVVLHRDATQWSVVGSAPAADYNDVWAAAHDRVFAATNDQGVVAYDGTSWQPVGSIGTGVKMIRGTSATDLWIIESDGSLWRGDGSSWTPAGVAGNFNSIAAIAPDDVWAVGLDASFAALLAHWNGSTWTTASDPFGGYASVSGTGPKDVWVATTAGHALHYDGTAWADVPVSFNNLSVGVVAVDPGSAFAFQTDGYAFHYSGQAFAHYSLGLLSSIRAVWAASASDIHLLNGTSIYHYDGRNFVKVFSEPHGAQFIGISGDSPTNVWALSTASIYHYDGTWTEQTAATGSSPSAVWVGGGVVWTFSQGAAHRGPAPWTDYSVGSFPLAGISGTSPNDLWGIEGAAATSGGALWHWNGASWQSVVTPQPGPFAVGARAPNDVFVATTGFHVLHWDGASWSDSLVQSLQPFRFIVPIAADDVYAASSLDLYHLDSGGWTRVRPDIDTTGPNLQIVGMVAPSPAHLIYIHQQQYVRDLMRTQPWVCRATETNCNDGVDDDCDGKIDRQDSDCP